MACRLLLLLLLRQEAEFVEPAKRDVHGAWFGLASVHRRFEAERNVAVSPDARTAGLLLVDVEMATLFLHVLAETEQPAASPERDLGDRTAGDRQGPVASAVALASSNAAVSRDGKRPLGNSDGPADEAHSARVALRLP